MIEIFKVVGFQLDRITKKKLFNSVDFNKVGIYYISQLFDFQYIKRIENIIVDYKIYDRNLKEIIISDIDYLNKVLKRFDNKRNKLLLIEISKKKKINPFDDIKEAVLNLDKFNLDVNTEYGVIVMDRNLDYELYNYLIFNGFYLDYIQNKDIMRNHIRIRKFNKIVELWDKIRRNKIFKPSIDFENFVIDEYSEIYGDKINKKSIKKSLFGIN